MAEEAKPLNTHTGITTLDKPYNIAGYLTMSAPANSIVSNYIKDKEPATEVDTVMSKLEVV